MRGWSESEGISYQTPILRKRNCFWEGNTKIKKFEWKPKSVEDQSQKLSRLKEPYFVKNVKHRDWGFELTLLTYKVF